ncbi:hypothetical protein C5167_021348 [Papaver somniferum]|uniref:Uncharacterized protein n=1 Tax=Papaver somniferum TaxID=3469 RepID=A0A4Y7IYQ0_PAPSO|nr:hypothetical protein C5167_021348 [Papaver somniferum]
MDECCSTQFIDGDGSFNVDGLARISKAVKLAEFGLSYAVVSMMGPQSSGTCAEIEPSALGLEDIDGRQRGEVAARSQRFYHSIAPGGLGGDRRAVPASGAIVVSTCAAVASIVTGVLAGMFALGEQLPSAPAARLLLLLGWVCIIFAVILLVSSRRLIQHLPRTLRRLVRSSTERSNNLRRSSSVRTRESNPSAVIQATTLHHLLTTTTAKEKA